MEIPRALACILVVAPRGQTQLLPALLPTSEFAATTFGPLQLVWAHGLEEGLRRLEEGPEACVVDGALGTEALDFVRLAREQGWHRPVVYCAEVGDVFRAAQSAGAQVLHKSTLSSSLLNRTLNSAILRSRFEETLRQGEVMLRQILAGARDVHITMLDAHGFIISQAGRADLRSRTAKGQPYDALFTVEDRDAGIPMRMLRQAVLQGHLEATVRRMGSDGALDAEVLLTPLCDPAGRVCGYSEIAKPVKARGNLAHGPKAR